MASGPDTDRPRGRRPGGEDTRGAILAAARSEFAGRGYDGTTLRGIARAAGVDPRLVHHYFEGKDDVFIAAMDFPVRPGDVVPQIIGPGPDGMGERLVRFFFAIWDPEPGRERVIALLASAMTSQDAARMIREFLTREVFERLVGDLGVDRPQLRASLTAAQMFGLVGGPVRGPAGTAGLDAGGRAGAAARPHSAALPRRRPAGLTPRGLVGRDPPE